MKRAAAPAGASGTDETKSFEQMMGRLEALVEKLEGGNLTLEESIRSFEEGMSLVKQCATVLQEAELRIQKLTREAEEAPAAERPGPTRSRREPSDADDELPF